MLYESTEHEVHVIICKIADDFPNFSLGIYEELKQHFLFDLDIEKENEILAAKKTSYFSAMNNSSIKTVSKLQVIQSSSEVNKGY